MTYIIKPDKYLEKQKVQMSVGKFNFNIQLVSVEQLFLEVDPSQLTADLEVCFITWFFVLFYIFVFFHNFGNVELGP